MSVIFSNHECVDTLHSDKWFTWLNFKTKENMHSILIGHTWLYNLWHTLLLINELASDKPVSLAELNLNDRKKEKINVYIKIELVFFMIFDCESADKNLN